MTVAPVRTTASPTTFPKFAPRTELGYAAFCCAESRRLFATWACSDTRLPESTGRVLQTPSALATRRPHAAVIVTGSEDQPRRELFSMGTDTPAGTIVV